jgi:hypothetical protein
MPDGDPMNRKKSCYASINPDGRFVHVRLVRGQCDDGGVTVLASSI